MKQKLMSAMEERDAGKPKLSGRVELDDAYLGGVRSWQADPCRARQIDGQETIDPELASGRR